MFTIQTKSIQKIYILILFFLIVINGISEGINKKYGYSFIVDNTTIFLLLIAFLPFLGKYIESFRFGNIEAHFRELSLSDQIFAFLEGVAMKERWTYYLPRGEEMHMGDAFRILVQEVNKINHSKLINVLRKFLDSDNPNLIWFASENIGYFKFEELKHCLPPKFNNLDKNLQWSEWQLNCLWAYSRFENYQGLHDFLMNTRNEVNQIWLLDVYRQMSVARHEELQYFISQLRKFINRNDVRDQVLKKARRVIEELEQELETSCQGQ